MSLDEAELEKPGVAHKVYPGPRVEEEERKK